MNKGCTTTATNTFLDASNIISTLSGGKLKAVPLDTETDATYEFCLKITDD